MVRTVSGQTSPNVIPRVVVACSIARDYVTVHRHQMVVQIVLVRQMKQNLAILMPVNPRKSARALIKFFEEISPNLPYFGDKNLAFSRSKRILIKFLRRSTSDMQVFIQGVLYRVSPVK